MHCSNFFGRIYVENTLEQWYTGPWALFGDVDTSEKKQMIGKAP